MPSMLRISSRFSDVTSAWGCLSVQ